MDRLALVTRYPLLPRVPLDEHQDDGACSVVNKMSSRFPLLAVNGAPGVVALNASRAAPEGTALLF